LYLFTQQQLTKTLAVEDE